MEPIEYLRIVQRRWKLVAAMVVVGALGAWVSSPAAQVATPGVQEFKATNTMVSDESSSTSVSLEAISFFTTVGDVPQRVAEKVGFEGDPAALAAQVTVTVETDIGILQISSTGSDGAATAELVNTFASEVRAFFDERQQAERARQLDAAQASVDSLLAQVNQLVVPPPEAQSGLATAERDAVLRQYSAALARLQELTSLPPATVGLVEFQPGTPVPVLEAGFQAPASRTGRAIIGGAMGLLLGAGLVLVLERVDTRLRSRATAEAAFGLPVLVEIPELARRHRREPPLAVVESPYSPAAGAYRSLCSSLVLMQVLRAAPPPLAEHNGNGNTSAEVPPSQAPSHVPRFVAAPRAPGDSDKRRVILVTSPGRVEGRTATVANLAACFAETGRSVVVVSCQADNQTLHRMLGLADGPGLSDVFSPGPSAPKLEDVVAPTSVPGVRAVGFGHGAALSGKLLAHGRTLMGEFAQMAPVVLVDANPLLAAGGAADLAPWADAVVVVGRIGRTSAESARRAVELLARIGAPVLGVAMVGTTGLGGRSGGARVTQGEVHGSDDGVSPALRPATSTGASPPATAPPRVQSSSDR